MLNIRTKAVLMFLSLSASLVSLAAFVTFIFYHRWWGLISPTIGREGQIDVLLMFSTNYFSYFIIFAFSVASNFIVIRLYYLFTHISFIQIIVLLSVHLSLTVFFLYAFRTAFSEAYIFRTPVGNFGYLDPTKIYLLFVLTSAIVLFAIYIVVLFSTKIHNSWRS